MEHSTGGRAHVHITYARSKEANFPARAGHRSSLLGLPHELVSQIIRHVAPLGGRKAEHLRLVNRHISTVASPILFSSLIIPDKPLNELDELLSAIFDNRLGIRKAATSLKYELHAEAFTLPALAIAKLLNIERLSLHSSTGQEVPDVVQNALARLPRLSTLKLSNLSLNPRDPAPSWDSPELPLLGRCTSGVKHLILDRHVDGCGLYAVRTALANAFAFRRNEVEILEVYLNNAVLIYQHLNACRWKARHIVLEWSGGGDPRFFLLNEKIPYALLFAPHCFKRADSFSSAPPELKLRVEQTSLLSAPPRWAFRSVWLQSCSMEATSSGSTPQLDLPTSLLDLPNETLSQIARDVAPLGGRKVQHLRLVNRRLAAIAAPVLFTSILIPYRTRQNIAELNLAILGDDGTISKATTSIAYTFSGSGDNIRGRSAGIIVDAFSNLQRVSLSAGYSGSPFPQLFEKVLARLPQVSHLTLNGFNIPPSEDSTLLSRCAPGVKHLILRQIQNVGVLVAFGFPLGHCPIGVEILEVYNAGGGLRRTDWTRDIFLLMAACMDSLREITLEWDGGEGLTPGMASTVMPPLSSPAESLCLQGLETLFSPRGNTEGHAHTWSTVTVFLEWVAKSRLSHLSLPVNDDFFPHLRLNNLCMPHVRHLTLSTCPRESPAITPLERFSRERDLLTPVRFPVHP
ncbi:hypothetical protein P7C70_g4722, partial [Phenoliferia sp. Uapishka_3]